METYVLKQPFDLETNGQNIRVEELEIACPCGAIHGLFSRLETFYGKVRREAITFFKGLNSLESEDDAKSEDKEKEKTEAEKINEFVETLSISGLETNEVYSVLKDILCHKKYGASINGTRKLERGDWDDIPCKEFKYILGFYIVNFIITSD